MEWLKKFDSIEKLTQGSIIDNVDWGYTKDCNPLSIVLSNACDLEHEGHCSYLIVAAMHLAADVIQASREYKGLLGDTPSDKITKKQRKGIERLYSDYIHNRTINRYFFIDCSEIEPNLYMVVDFQELMSVEYKGISKYRPVAHLLSPLREHLMMRFVCYTARISIDRVDENREKEIISKLTEDR